MDIFTKIEVANDIISSLIAKKINEGMEPTDEVILDLFNQKNMLNKVDESVLDEVIKEYGKLVKNN